jgi:signal transduction histidine kinase
VKTTPNPKHDAPRDAQGALVPEGLAKLDQQLTLQLEQIERAVAEARLVDSGKLARCLAELRALAAQNAVLHAEMEARVEVRIAERTRELVSLLDFLQTHSEREKALLARELHDALGGILTPVRMDLSWLESRLGKDPEYSERMGRLSRLVDQGIDLKRRIIEKLHPSLLDHLGLASAVNWYVEEECRAAKVECRLRVSEKLERLPSDLEIALYRVVQECLSNIVKHSQARTMELALERTERGLELTVQDDGVGIADLELARKLSHGLAGMGHRVRALNGTFEVRSQPGQGTRVTVFVPLQ